MKYTIQNGVEHRFSERVKSNIRFILPLLIVLAGVTFFLLNPYSDDRKAAKPLTLGIYTIPSSNQDDKKSNGDKDNNGSNVPPSTASIAASGMNNSSASDVNGTATAMPVGGRGGDPVQGNAAPPPATTTPPPTPVSTTISCVETLTQTTLICVFPYQYCTIPLAPTLGVKTIDGTCVIIN